MTSLCCHLSAQEIVNWVTTADGCVHTANRTPLDSFVASESAVCIGHYCGLLLSRQMAVMKCGWLPIVKKKL